MTYDNGEYRARAHEAVTGDHYPVCPKCGDLCGVHAQLCITCGTRLKPTEAELKAAARDARIQGMQPTQHDPEATRETGP